MNTLSEARKNLIQARCNILSTQLNNVQQVAQQFEIAQHIIEAQMGVEFLQKDLEKKEK